MKKITNGNASAYGFVDNRSNSYEDNEVHYGLTKKEYFAAICLQGILANSALYKIAKDRLSLNDYPVFYATCAIEHADALIEELNK